ncbi:prepilin-type N-terminal cleavage/methylation domain-containing protein [Geotalea sp. SG265]|uniref:type II secretion system protein n=1 Tax=Geotalea sp. SG265 TaxID=2922867 RepID=UPI001FAE7FE7|nr:prepilin-type N-terminal cleavage/methylation domain-containing protein [Geotalea sp. SG265]
MNTNNNTTHHKSNKREGSTMNNTIKNQKGFTLVEMLVMLLILGLVVVILVSVFADPFKTASSQSNVTRVVDQISQLSNAADSYYTWEKRPYSDADFSGLTNKGYLKGVPKAPENIFDGDSQPYVIDRTTYSFPAVVLSPVKGDFCLALDKKAAALAENSAVGDIPAAVNSGKNVQCISDGGSPAVYTVIGKFQ